eukprot:UN01890
MCEAEDNEHYMVSAPPGSSVDVCAAAVEAESQCSTMFYYNSGPLSLEEGDSSLCTCVRCGHKCNQEEADEEFMGISIYLLNR